MVFYFLAVKCLSAFNGVLGKPLLRALKAVTSIHRQTIKFPTIVGTDQLRGSQRDFRECYSKSLELAENGQELPQAIEVEKISESTAWPIEELNEIQVDTNDLAMLLKLAKD